MNKTLSRGLMACLSLVALASCQDYDGGFSLDTIKKAEYAKHFEDTFGKIDPNQDWSMATLVKANVNLPGLTGTAKMNICTGDPRNSETRLLAQIMLKDGKGSIDFDAIKGSENVFVTVEQDGEYKVFSQYALQNGMLNIGNITPEMLLASAPLTRGFSGTCPTTQSTTGNYLVDAKWATYQVVTGTAIKYNSDTKSYDEWIAAALANGNFNAQNGTTYYPFTDASVRRFVKVNGIDWANSSPVLKSGAALNTETLYSWNSSTKSLIDWKTSVGDSWQTKLNGWQNPSLYETSSIKFSSNGNIDWAGSSLVLKDGAQFSTEEYIIDQWGNGKSKSYYQEQGDQFANNIKNHWSNPTPWTYESFVFNDNGTIDWTNCTYVLQDGWSRCNAGDGIAWSQYGQPKFTLVSTTKSDAETSLASLKADWGNPSPWEDSFAFTETGAIDWTNSTLTLRTGALETPPGEVITYNGQTKTIAEWKADAENSLQAVFQHNTYNGPWENSSLEPDAEDCEPNNTWPCIFKDVWPTSHWILKDDIENVPTYGTEHVKVQYLDGVETAPAPAWDAMLGNSFFGAGSFFEEGTAYYTDGKKLNVYYDETQMRSMENGFSIHTTAETTITLPYIFGCTSFANQFGYVYWTDEEAQQPGFDVHSLKHFCLIENARPGSNITYTDRQTSTPTAIGHSEFSKDRWPSLVDLERNYIGTSYQAMWFGNDRSNATGSYTFPANCNIIFWIAELTRSGEDGNETTYEPLLYTEHNPLGVFDSFNYSDPQYNVDLGHLNTKRPGGPVGLVKCIAWTHDGNTYMGFGDNCGDEDLNDIVFLVSGNFETNNIIKVAPIKWHLNYNEKHHDGTNGTTKDDDLHDIYSLNIHAEYSQPATNPTRTGFTFKGWATTPTGTPSMTINGTVADESGACYFAIWEPVGESVKIRWHLNYDGTHIVKHNGEDGHDVYATNTVAKSTGTYNKPSTNPTRSGYTFRGWATEPNATEPNAFTGDNPEDQTAEKDVCYYALWEEVPTPGPDPAYISWRFACEDLGGTFDYDFNDVVWEVQKTKVGEEITAVKVRLLAAGGTLPFTLKYNGTKICTKDEAFGTSSSPVNAGPGTVSKEVQEYTVNGIGTDWTVSDNYTKFSVEVEVKDTGASTMIQAYQKDQTLNNKAPQVILLPGTWQWPTERTPIDEAYLEFTIWVSNNNYVSWPEPVSGKTVSK